MQETREELYHRMREVWGLSAQEVEALLEWETVSALKKISQVRKEEGFRMLLRCEDMKEVARIQGELIAFDNYWDLVGDLRKEIGELS